MSDCFCDFDYPEFYRSEQRKAAKPHRCYECRAAILPGNVYEYVSAKSDGSIWVAKTCSKCTTLREYVTAHVPCFCWSHGNMLEEARETIVEYAHECPGLFMGYGRRLVAVNRARTQHGS